MYSENWPNWTTTQRDFFGDGMPIVRISSRDILLAGSFNHFQISDGLLQPPTRLEFKLFLFFAWLINLEKQVEPP